MSESNEWQINGNRVYRNGHSYKCPNIKTAQDLQHTLNTYHATYTRHKQIEQKLDRITKTLIQLQLTNGIMTEELRKLHEEII